MKVIPVKCVLAPFGLRELEPMHASKTYALELVAATSRHSGNVSSLAGTLTQGLTHFMNPGTADIQPQTRRRVSSVPRRGPCHTPRKKRAGQRHNSVTEPPSGKFPFGPQHQINAQSHCRAHLLQSGFGMREARHHGPYFLAHALQESVSLLLTWLSRVAADDLLTRAQATDFDCLRPKWVDIIAPGGSSDR